ncbi:MAG TPA: Gfo/Idh/MocA family oxidoreductase [Thermoanaerobaculia bacterium]|nr:Gfo/Idh/MocA family oxidoreductase [Thermoanaerobaculia bacterium]
MREQTRQGAIIGVGNVALNGHLPGWLTCPEVEIVAAADVREEGRAALAERLPDARWYSSVDALLAAEKLDFVDICTPPAFHFSAIRLALEAGAHVLCEKPLVLSSTELASLGALALEQALVLATVHNWRHAPVVLRATELVRSGAIGSVSSVRWETLRDKPAASSGQADNWRVDPAVAGGGILVDHGWHALYAIQQWVQGEPDRVSARLESGRAGKSDIEDTADVTLDYPAARAEIFLTWTAGERANRVTLEGSAGTITIDGASLEFRPASGEPSRREGLAGALSEGSHHPDWFRGVVEEFLGEIREPGRRGRSLVEAQRCLRWIETAYESGRRKGEGLPVTESSVEPVFGAAS